MNMEAIREWLNRQPFEPFVLRMSNGEVHEVRHPECVALGKNRIAVSFPEQDRFVHLSLIHVNAIEAPFKQLNRRRSLMALEGAREALRLDPFEPFVFRLADGRTVPVHHPEFVAVGKRRLVVIDEDDGWSFVEPMLIISIYKMKKTPPGGVAGAKAYSPCPSGTTKGRLFSSRAGSRTHARDRATCAG
jgi:hypothetical protein